MQTPTTGNQQPIDLAITQLGLRPSSAKSAPRSPGLPFGGTVPDALHFARRLAGFVALPRCPQSGVRWMPHGPQHLRAEHADKSFLDAPRHVTLQGLRVRMHQISHPPSDGLLNNRQQVFPLHGGCAYLARGLNAPVRPLSGSPIFVDLPRLWADASCEPRAVDAIMSRLHRCSRDGRILRINGVPEDFPMVVQLSLVCQYIILSTTVVVIDCSVVTPAEPVKNDGYSTGAVKIIKRQTVCADTPNSHPRSQCGAVHSASFGAA